MSKSTRRGYHHLDLRNALLTAALELVDAHGVEGLTLREAARRAGVSHAAPYRHFPDKESLLAAVAERGFELLKDATLDGMKRSRAPAPRVEACGVAYVTFAVRNPALFRLMFSRGQAARGVVEGEPASSLDEAARRSFEVLLDAIRDGQAAKVFQGREPHVAALAAWSVVHGFASLVIEQRVPDRELEATARAVIGTCMSGLLR